MPFSAGGNLRFAQNAMAAGARGAQNAFVSTPGSCENRSFAKTDSGQSLRHIEQQALPQVSNWRYSPTCGMTLR